MVMPSRFPDLVTLFSSLPLPASDVGLGRFCAVPIPGYSSCALGKDINGNPALLIHAAARSSMHASPHVLEHLSLIHLVNCRVQIRDRPEEDQVLSIIRCTDADPTLQAYFLRSIYPIAAALPESPTHQQVSIAIDRLVDLFRQLTQSPRKTIAGLWAELLLIARASNPHELIQAWHAIPEEPFDFFAGTSRIEVKAASGPIRLHHFSLDQLHPPADVRVLVASFMLRIADGGASVNDLVDTIRARVRDPNLLIQLDSGIAQTLGHHWRSARDNRFDLQAATQSLRFFDAARVPSVATPVPSEVTAVHFRVDLTHHQELAIERLAESSRLFCSAAPVADH